jgi:GAF domain-containing protein
MGTAPERGSAGSELAAMAGRFQELLGGMTDDDGILQMDAVMSQATTAIPGAEHAAISLSRRGQEPRTVFATGEVPIRVDAVQYSLDEGPCVSALEQNDIVWVNDLSADPQFPRFGPAAVELGVRSMLSTRLMLSRTNRAALNLYSSKLHGFQAEHLPIAAIFASYASLLLVNQLLDNEVVGLERALESNREIGVAMGIMMAAGRYTQAEAFGQLVDASQHLNRRVRDIASEVALTGAMPSVPGRARRAKAD